MIAIENERIRINKKIDDFLGGCNMKTRFVVFGCTPYTRTIIEALSRNNRKADFIVDNSPEKWGKSMGIAVTSPYDGLVPFSEEIVIIICSKYYQEMIGQIHEYGYMESNILNIMVDECNCMQIDLDVEFKTAKKKVLEGYELYLNIKKQYSSDAKLLLCPYPGTGDVYMACSLLDYYLQREKITNYVLIVVGNSCVKIAMLYDICNVKEISDKQMRLLLDAWIFLSDYMDIKPLLHWNWRTKRFMNMDDNNLLTFSDMFQFDVFEYDCYMKYKHFIPKENEKCVEDFFEKESLVPGKTIIIAPYASSFEADISKAEWEEIVKILKRKGYVVCTNTIGEKEPAITGTIPLFFKYDDAVQVLEKAGGFIGVRSGLCDVVSQSKCKMVIIYDRKYSAAKKTHFGLKNMGVRLSAVEIDNPDELIETVKAFF